MTSDLEKAWEDSYFPAEGRAANNGYEYSYQRLIDRIDASEIIAKKGE